MTKNLDPLRPARRLLDAPNENRRLINAILLDPAGRRTPAGCVI
jgi:hypothetical protein